MSIPKLTEVAPAEELLDAVVVGAGPAGLTALIYLARFHRNAVALGGQGQRPRCELIDRTYNLPGYPDGVNGASLVKRLLVQAQEYGGRVLPQFARKVDKVDNAFRIELADGTFLRARKVVLAMGVSDRAPDVPEIREHEGKFLRYCPVCDGYEHTGQCFGIVGSGPSVARHALFLQTFSNNITLFLHGAPRESLGRYEAILLTNNIDILEPRITSLLVDDSPGRMYRGAGVCLADGSEQHLDVLYSALGCDQHNNAIKHLNLTLDEEGYVLADVNQETSLPGLYAAGDVTNQINQITVAFGQAAIAAVRIHNALDHD